MSGGRRALLAALWVSSLIVAFLVGTQFPLGAARGTAAATPAAGAATPASGAGGGAAAPSKEAASAAPTASATVDPELEKFLLALPRRQQGDPLALGRTDAKVVMSNWSDYRCPFCARWHQQTLPALQKYIDDGTLRVEFRDMSIFGDMSDAAAVGARAAGKQGKFWQFQGAVFAAAPPEGGHPDITRADVLAFARTAGVGDLKAFEKDLDDPALLAAVKEDTAYAKDLGISGTPFFVIGGTVLSGAYPVETFEQIIAKESAR